MAGNKLLTIASPSFLFYLNKIKFYGSRRKKLQFRKTDYCFACCKFVFRRKKEKEKEVVVMKQIKWWQENNVFLI